LLLQEFLALGFPPRRRVFVQSAIDGCRSRSRRAPQQLVAAVAELFAAWCREAVLFADVFVAQGFESGLALLFGHDVFGALVVVGLALAADATHGRVHFFFFLQIHFRKVP